MHDDMLVKAGRAGLVAIKRINAVRASSDYASEQDVAIANAHAVLASLGLELDGWEWGVKLNMSTAVCADETDAREYLIFAHSNEPSDHGVWHLMRRPKLTVKWEEVPE